MKHGFWKFAEFYKIKDENEYNSSIFNTTPYTLVVCYMFRVKTTKRRICVELRAFFSTGLVRTG